ncbi:TPA: putative 2-aminoethylphosphonate ABC transporter permease subunit [Acinetobacter nosocomialis]|uniref:putative 2-aminoethylphosphonate ABC transporter permease subunit n=1 Tax=Acinetobacter nosocomialis TaxID=106654 RepID=UPI000317C48D|nr:putative 2-aminoethylphosphonate ABC transporter permease subunit [Acinetobacter nosocomialis]ARG17401.1 phosphonate ABC transporter permease [Acinetobacter nosocomialis]AWL19641.1 putative 2-aminoethylphosphonate ABC transporter permease subunit [Acinetobacter nosocomialis]MBM9550302.1 putative 2-aminoethylphosphonate ABC transporter permease subunit [Acinetobacter nosocomialis]MBP1469690.1 putative 2-aminoethylphosphonate ABC transporter permease subunit [Acinetobacter nosocomialis]MBR769
MLNEAASAVLKTQPRRKTDYSLRSNIALASVAIALTLAIIAPLIMLFETAFFDENQNFVGLENFYHYFGSPALLSSVFNSVWVACTATVITVLLASVYAFALTNVNIKGKSFFKLVAFLPILAPSLLPSLALVYLFGKQGVLKPLLGDIQIYGPIGILISYCFWLFPAILMLMMVSFRSVDQRLIEASLSLGKNIWKTHYHVTLPAIRYGLISASLVAFIYVLTDFGIPKVIGGSFNMMALDVYKQIIGQQNMSMGAVISILLLLPAVFVFIFDRIQSKRHTRFQAFQAKPYVSVPNKKLEVVLSLFCGLVSGAILLIIFTAVLASFIQSWPYDLSLTLAHYSFEYVDGGGWAAYFNSIRMALFSTFFGTALIFMVVLLTERFKAYPLIKNYVQALVLLPLAVPGLVLGIAYILFFNQQSNPLNVLYGTMTILVISTIVHYYTVPHLTLTNAIKQIPLQLDQAAETLGTSKWKTFWKVYLPMCFPALCDVSVYIFVNAMTTVSAAIFLYSPDTSLAAVAVLNMDDAGDTVAAVAMSILILTTSCVVKLIHWLFTRKIMARSQQWRESAH